MDIYALKHTLEQLLVCFTNNKGVRKSIIPEAYSKPCQTSKMERFAKKMLHPRCLKGFWMRIWKVPSNFRWTESEWSPCSRSCGGGRKTRNIYCVLRDGIEEYTLQYSQCQNETRPARIAVCNLEPCPPTWYPEPYTEVILHKLKYFSSLGIPYVIYIM